MKTEDLINILKNKYSDSRFVKLIELRMGTGYNSKANKNVESRLDYWVLDTYPSSKHVTVGYECKISLSDYKNEIKTPNKQAGALLISNEFYYIAPKGIIPLNLIPEWAGLIEIGEKNKWIVSKVAPFRKIKDASWNFVSSLGRRINAVESTDIKNLSDDILIRMLTALYEGNQDKLTIDEFSFYVQLLKEHTRRSNIKYNKQNSDSKLFQRFSWHIKSFYPYIPTEVLQNLWKCVKINKLRTKKTRIRFINEELTEEQKSQYKQFRRK